MRAAAPGKIILSGEHAVVYGKPALVMAFDRYSFCDIQFTNQQLVELKLPDFDFHQQLTFHSLFKAAKELFERYQLFVDGSLDIKSVTRNPGDVFIYLLSLLLELTPRVPYQGLSLSVTSQLQTGGGTGSSASTISGALVAIAAILDLALDDQTRFDIAVKVENMLHGRSSGVDPWVCLHGGFNRFQQGTAQRKSAPNFDLHMAFSGNPSASTGESVDRVRTRYTDSSIWQEFEKVTDNLETALINNETDEILSLIKYNHQLLCRIGVVPETVQKVIKSIEEQGGAAKISGAGSVTGDAAGAVLISDPNKQVDFKNIPYPVIKTTKEETGARVIQGVSPG